MNKYQFLVLPMLLAFSSCIGSSTMSEVTLNREAALNGALPHDPLKWAVITSGSNPHESTMSTLFGNDVAVQYARRYTEGHYPDGSVLSLVTWRQQPDGHWFGAKMPGSVQSVEFVEVTTNGDGVPFYLYRKYEGSPLKETKKLQTKAGGRANDLIALRAAVMP